MTTPGGASAWLRRKGYALGRGDGLHRLERGRRPDRGLGRVEQTSRLCRGQGARYLVATWSGQVQRTLKIVETLKLTGRVIGDLAIIFSHTTARTFKYGLRDGGGEFVLQRREG